MQDDTKDAPTATVGWEAGTKQDKWYTLYIYTYQNHSHNQCYTHPPPSLCALYPRLHVGTVPLELSAVWSPTPSSIPLSPWGSSVSSSRLPVPLTNSSYVDFSGNGRGPNSSIMSSLCSTSFSSNRSATYTYTMYMYIHVPGRWRSPLFILY